MSAGDGVRASTGRRLHNDERVVAWTQQLRHGRVLRVVLERLETSGVAALPVKGIVSARTLYPDLADRLLTDVDLKIRPDDYPRVLATGQREGWRVTQRMRAYRNVVFVIDDVSVDIEGYTSAPWLSHLTVDDMMRRARQSDVLGFPHLLPDFDDHAVVLLLNVFKDKLVYAFNWSVRDVERLPQHDEFSATRLVERLRESGASTIGWIVADWMVRERGIPAWRTVRDAIGKRPPRNGYVALLQWLRKRQPLGAMALRILSRAGSDERADRARALVHMLGFQAEVWLSRGTDAPFRRQDPSQVPATPFSENRKPP